jgi:hypothetical protein
VGQRPLVGKFDGGGFRRGTDAVCQFAHTRHGWCDGRETVFSFDLGGGGVRAGSADIFKEK